MAERQESILIVDDEAAVRRLLRRRVAMEGYWCEEAGSGDEALNKIRSNPVGLVILDIKMPSRSGVELLPEIEATHPDMAVIMVTAATNINTAIQCMKQGAYDYITKPFNLDEVTLSIESPRKKKARVGK